MKEKRYFLFASVLALFETASLAKVYFVSASASDSGTGTLANPFKKIQSAATILQRGDTCYVRSGTYREWVKPMRGGTSEDYRIIYRAYPGETPEIKGSERITSWIRDNGNIWRAQIPDAVFGAYNPFKKKVSGDYLNWGGHHHLGDVYLDGKVLKEKFTRSALDSTTLTWFTDSLGAIDSTTRIFAHFGGKDPNASLTEINVRESAFHPVVSGLRYITLDGFTIRHGASNWAANTGHQKGLVGTWGGRNWTIKNCHITDAKCVGIAATIVTGVPFDITSIGHHVIHNNTVERCGQAAIVGYRGLSSSIIAGNLLQDINTRLEFGGYETGGIKFHLTADLLIKGNIIRRVGSGGPGVFPGIWIDWSNQGIRVTGNVIKDIQDGNAVFVEMNHGPNLIDNNIFSGAGITMGSDRTIVAHNLFAMAQWKPDPDMVQVRVSGYNFPHTLRQAGRGKPSLNLGDRVLSNIFIERGPNPPISTVEFQSAYNIYYQGAAKHPLDVTGIQSTFAPTFTTVDDSNGVTVSFHSDNAPLSLGAPLITHALIGVYSVVNQGIKDKHGNPINIDEDILGAKRSPLKPTTGPLEKLVVGKNSFRLEAGKSAVNNSVFITVNTIRRDPTGRLKQDIPGKEFTTDGRRIHKSSGVRPGVYSR